METGKGNLEVLAPVGNGFGIDGVKGGQDRFPRRDKRLPRAQALVVVKQLLEGVEPSKDGQMMVQPPNVRRLIGRDVTS